ncbi:hypothetical protein CEE39_06910 [bacterium (candidate division B38) B3_B38]|nr:MAG: hypothetical protein CEE39_06910 [bacterium (candidate division B38) B3_B38]
MVSMEGVSIVIPVYNEEESILELLQGLSQFLEKNDIHHEVIVVNDGSKDRTAEIIRESGLRVELIEHGRNRGYGASLKTGIKSAQYDYVVTIDADGTYHYQDIKMLLEEAVETDMVVAARTGHHVSIPFIRRPAKWAITKLANYLTGEHIPDLNSGFRLLKKNIVNKFVKILPDGFSFTATITLAMLTNNYKIKYITTNYYKRKGKSKIRPIRDTINFVQLIARTILYFDPLKIFLPVSAIMFFASAVVFFYTLFFKEKLRDTTVLLLFLTGIILLAIGMLSDVVVKTKE